ATIEGSIHDKEESLNSEYFLADHMMQFENSDFLQADPSTTVQIGAETASNQVNYIPNMEQYSRAFRGPDLSARDVDSSLGLTVPSRRNSSQDPYIQLRSASQKPKNRKNHQPAPSRDIVRARKCHNQVEKKYRNRLRIQFENLLAVLPTAQASTYTDRDTAGHIGYSLSRGQVLDAARDRILELEKKVELLNQENNWLLKDMYWGLP
ncbi:Allergen Fus c 3, partial [Fusarium odoratissimum]